MARAPGEMRHEFDTIIVGGGLQSALLVLALDAQQPQARIALVEKASTLGGNHIWCFHAGDLSASARSWVEPLVIHRWPGYRVHFPGLQRRIDREYRAITSARLHEVVAGTLQRRPESRLVLGIGARHVEAHAVDLDDGGRLTARLVVDARGPQVESGSRRSEGYQKFLGLEVELSEPHGMDLPILMDATVSQEAGFRFLYTLPLSPRRLLVEDTYFSDTPDLQRDALRANLLEHLATSGCDVQAVLREEDGTLPMPWRGQMPRVNGSPLRAGYRGGFFHPGTGYSFPIGLRLAEQLAAAPLEAPFGPGIQALVRAYRCQAAFCHLLNYMLFCCFPPNQRWHVFQRFYALPLTTIERFYSLRLEPLDMGRLLCGRPPRGMSLRYALTRGARS